MSFQDMTWAIEQKLKTNEKMVLLMLANHNNGHTGQCNPSHKRLADECGMGKTALLTAIKRLEKEGYLNIIKQRFGDMNLPNQYHLNVNKIGSSPNGLPYEPPSRSYEPPSPSYAPPSSFNEGGGSPLDEPETVITEPVRKPISETVITTPPENFYDSVVKLNAVQYEVYVWASSHEYWNKATTSEEDFLRAYCSPKGGMRKQFEQRHNVKSTLNQQPTKNQPPINPFAEQLKRENESVIDSTATQIHQQQIGG